MAMTSIKNQKLKTEITEYKQHEIKIIITHFTFCMLVCNRAEQFYNFQGIQKSVYDISLF